MSSPYPARPADYQDGVPTHRVHDGLDESVPDIPRRIMRVKVLYTFDNENKTHCLARLVNPVPIQVVALDESTEIGVVELRTCIQAIVAASPEMIAKLENDYTVYAYDYSEYETPLVGQGMLSWVLATASPTPNAPAKESGTMVTGRVCKNILGLFASGGIKETLEVKLKLVPVPTRSKREYLQSMAVYRDPNVVMPEGFDNNAWNSFLQAIPDVSMTREGSSSQPSARANVGGVEQLHSMLTPKFAPEDDVFSNGPGSSRAGSPTPSHRSISNYPTAYPGSRPTSRASFHQPPQSESAVDDQGFEDGPAKKRARLQQAEWHGRGSFGTHADTLRAAVSTSASIRGFRPSITGNSSAGGDLIPRAPTPRPGEKKLGRPGMPRGGSSLRRQSLGGAQVYSNPDSELSRNDSGIYSLEYDAGSSRHGSPSPDLPSSPPEYTPIEAPSSPLPELPQIPDSGFQSDTPAPRPRSSNLKPPVNAHLQRKATGVLEWAHIEPGPRENLPTSSYPDFDPLSQKSALAAQKHKAPASPTSMLPHHRGGRAPSKSAADIAPPLLRQPSTTPAPIDEPSPSMYNALPSIEQSMPPTPVEYREDSLQPPASHLPTIMPPTILTQPAPYIQPSRQPILAAATPAASRQPPHLQRTASQGPASSSYVLESRNGETKTKPGSKTGRPPKRTLKKAQSWTAAAAESSDADSDAGAVARSNRGSGAIRSRSIHNQLETAVTQGAPPRFCCQCGEIKTPTWRPYWLRINEGNGTEVKVDPATGVHMVESVEWDESGRTTKYRVFKIYSHLTDEEKRQGTALSYQRHYFCNPCGDFIRKHAKFRPREMWDPAFIVPKADKKRSRKSKNKTSDALTSDMPAPSSEWDMVGPYSDMAFFTDPFGPSEGQFDLPSDMQHSFGPSPLPQPNDESTSTPQAISTMTRSVPLNDVTPQDHGDSDAMALQKAIQSSPARILMAQSSPNDAESGLTPEPTRRLLFPSPRKDGEFKSLESAPAVRTDANNAKVLTPSKNKSNVEKSVSMSGRKTSNPTASSTENSLEVDKENLPPPFHDDDEFAHLFDEGIFQSPPSKMKTPSKAVPRTPNSKADKALNTGLTPRSIATGLTPRVGSKRGSDCMGPPETPTPTKRRSPRIAEKSAARDMTPFTRSLNQLLSDGLTSSPSRAFNWTLTSSPAKNLSTTFGDMAAMSKITATAQSHDKQTTQEELAMWSDFPMPSSPPFFSQQQMHGRPIMSDAIIDYDWNLGVDVWEDGTATDPIKGWDNIFDEQEKAGDEADEKEEKDMVAVTVTEVAVAAADGTADSHKELTAIA